MLDQITSEKLLSAILERFDTTAPDQSGLNQLAHQIIQIAAKVSVVALQEYEQLNQPSDSSDSSIP